MNYGTFPAVPDPSTRVSQAGTWPRGELEADSVQASRRAVLAGLGGLVIGSLGGSFLLGGRVGPQSVGTPRSGGSASLAASNAAAREGMPAWAADMLSMDAQSLLLAAGEFERRSARHREDRPAAAGFERLLAVALASRQREADMAASCAIRSLQRLGRTDLVAIWAPDIRQRADLIEANGELADILDRALRQRRRMIPR